MPKKLVIAEKPSVARDIASALGGFKARGKVFERDDMIVCSASGHLVELCMPEEIDKKKYGFWRLDTLPILPETFPLKPSKSNGYRGAVRKRRMRKIRTVKEVPNCSISSSGRQNARRSLALSMPAMPGVKANLSLPTL